MISQDSQTDAAAPVPANSYCQGHKHGSSLVSAATAQQQQNRPAVVAMSQHGPSDEELLELDTDAYSPPAKMPRSSPAAPLDVTIAPSAEQCIDSLAPVPTLQMQIRPLHLGTVSEDTEHGSVTQAQPPTVVLTPASILKKGRGKGTGPVSRARHVSFDMSGSDTQPDSRSQHDASQPTGVHAALPHDPPCALPAPVHTIIEELPSSAPENSPAPSLVVSDGQHCNRGTYHSDIQTLQQQQQRQRQQQQQQQQSNSGSDLSLTALSTLQSMNTPLLQSDIDIDIHDAAVEQQRTSQAGHCCLPAATRSTHIAAAIAQTQPDAGVTKQSDAEQQGHAIDQPDLSRQQEAAKLHWPGMKC